jgi:hypothetical protein
MPSTYSSNLRLELIATGEQAGTWGTTTNTNWSALMEAAVAGYISVSVTTANQALTTASGATDQARTAIVELTTTTTANFNVYIPPTSKSYIFRNNTAYTATIFNSTVIGNTTAAGAGATVLAGQRLAVFSTGVVCYLLNLPGIEAYAPLNSPTFTGIPAAPTPGTNINTTQIPTTAWVNTWFAPLASPPLTGIPTAPTPGTNINTTQISTTSWVNTWFAPLASPTLTGDPKAPTPAVSDNDTSIATTAFTQTLVTASIVPGVGAPVWVSGNTYVFGNVVFSPLDLQSYRCAVAGVSTTDPSLDTVTWTPISLPSQVGNAGLEVTTNGTSASWGNTNSGALAILNILNFGF